MSPMSRNDSATSLMGFSVHQPAIGAPLQFFPAMGSKQLDEMIDAYIPGDISILDKRAAVSMEFFEYTIATGDLFKFFMVYPTLGSTSGSPTMNSGSHSFATSPALSESQWSNPSPQMASPSSSKKPSSPNDFSNLPGMKIMTKDGRDVTNSASRGCKTKEQRDHAHLMRIIKACDSCRRKKTKCDPSHKRPAAGTSSGRIAKKAGKNPRPAAAPPQIPTEQASVTPELDQLLSDPSFDSFFTESLNAPMDAFTTEWDQYIQYDQEPAEAIPYDYDFFLDPAGYFSPTTTTSFSSSSTSPSQVPITPIDRDVNITDGTVVGHDHKPLLPYLDPAGLEAGNNYVDFNLYSPPSSFLDEELGLAKEVAASPIQSKRRDPHDHGTYADQDAVISTAAFEFSNNTPHTEPLDSYRQDRISDVARDGFLHDASNYMNYVHQWLESPVVTNITSQGGVLDLQQSNLSSDGQAARSPVIAEMIPAGLSITDDVLESATSEGLYGREAIYERLTSRRIPGRSRPQSSPVPNAPAELATELREQQAVLHAGVDVVPPRQSSSPDPFMIRSCGQDELSSAQRSAVSSATIVDPTTRIALEQQQGESDNVRRIRPTTVAQNATYRDPGEAASSPLPTTVRSSMIVTSSSNTGTANTRATSEPRSRPTTKAEQRVTVTVTTQSITAQPSLARQELSSAVLWNLGGEPQYATGVSAGANRILPAMPSQSVSSNTKPSQSIMAGLDLLPVVVSLASLRKTTTKGSGLTEGERSSTLGSAVRCAVAVLLFFLPIYPPSSFMPLLSIIVLSVVGSYIQLQRHTPHPDAQRQSSILSATHGLPYAKQLISTIDNFRFSYAQALRVVQCNVTRKLKVWTHPQIKSTTRSHQQETTRDFKATPLSHVLGRGTQTFI
ncbi:hypothetical protein F5Y10DRAFT_234528 [Nemania abortiva]|nr:hypothetical protein F5Y10DRAFT_234528 [Nemania abortiva]